MRRAVLGRLTDAVTNSQTPTKNLVHRANLPGTLLAKLTDCIFSPKVQKTIILSAIADAQQEYLEALSEAEAERKAGRSDRLKKFKAFMVRVRLVYDLLKALGFYSVMSSTVAILKKVARIG